MSLINIIKGSINCVGDIYFNPLTQKGLKVAKKGLQFSDVILESHDLLTKEALFKGACDCIKGNIQQINYLGSIGIVSYWKNSNKEVRPLLQDFSMGCLTFTFFGKIGLNLYEYGVEKKLFIIDELAKNASVIGQGFPILQQVQGISAKTVFKTMGIAGSLATVMMDLHKVYQAREAMAFVEKGGNQAEIEKCASKLSKAYWSLATDGLEFFATVAAMATIHSNPLLIGLNISAKGLSFYKAVQID